VRVEADGDGVDAVFGDNFCVINLLTLRILIIKKKSIQITPIVEYLIQYVSVFWAHVCFILLVERSIVLLDLNHEECKLIEGVSEHFLYEVLFLLQHLFGFSKHPIQLCLLVRGMLLLFDTHEGVQTIHYLQE
jgi:hypothetical protein